jgi:ADP-ribose pyrophosphatase
VGLAADSWHTLLDVHPSPGMSTESVRIYLARDPRQATSEHARSGEEAELEQRWVDLDDAVARVEAGEITNGLAVSGLLAAVRARDRRFAGLHPAG